MGYEKEKQIVNNDNKRGLSRTLRGNSKEALDFTASPTNTDTRRSVSDVFVELVSAIADREVDYITIGCSRDGGAILVTITTTNGIKSYAGGTNWDRLARELDSLFA